MASPENIDIYIDIDMASPENIDIDIDKDILKISISIREFCKISISIKYRIDKDFHIVRRSLKEAFIASKIVILN